ncbi:MAG TPA: C4-type zinc ribbon domain-containing protein [Actinomycetota bacterium]|nr:C4-type zinc ribbon domain-containing protein [Actinomycetota bacterium]
MNPSHQNLLDLLEVQKLDSIIDRLEHRKKHLPEQLELDRLQEELGTLERSVAEQQTLVDDAANRQKRLDTDIETLSLKIKGEEARLYDGKVSSPRELSGLQAEIESLKKRKGVLEDSDLEIMEEREAAENQLQSVEEAAAGLKSQMEEAIKARDLAVVEIDSELGTTRAGREEWQAKIDVELLAFYDDVRSSKGGVGAAALVDGTCQGCHMKLPAQEVQRIRSAEGIIRCDDCRRILVVV